MNSHGTLATPGARKALAGFFVSGILLAYLGAIMPAWGQHIQSDYWMVGLYFVALIAGLVIAARAASRIMTRKGIGWTLACACLIASGALLYLAFFSPPFPELWRLPGLLSIGFSAGLLHTGIFHAISPMYRHDPAATVNLAGVLFGFGCVSVALWVSRTFYFYTPAAIQIWIAFIPALFAVGYARSRFAPDTETEHPHMLLDELRSPVAVLFSLLLFFQFGNEWAIAGWLPMFLTQRLGISPPSAIMLLALYWMALLIGRVAAQWILPRVHHAKFLFTCVLVAIFACIILISTNNSFGAISGVVALGCAFAPIYPLVIERIGHRFPEYRPGFYNGIFSFAVAGGMLAPGAVGYFAWLLDVRAVMALPLIGSIVVFLLLGGIWLEARLSASVIKSSSMAK